MKLSLPARIPQLRFAQAARSCWAAFFLLGSVPAQAQVYRYDSAREGNLCRITSIRFTIDGEVLLPQWRPTGIPNAELKRRWDVYLAALERHEQGHVQHAEELVAMARQRILANGAQACESLDARTQASFNQVSQAMKERDREYDVRTGHGASQGATF